MELLLTSSGISTPAIAEQFTTMTAKTNRKVGFVPTAANVESGNKDWYLNQITDLQKYGYNWIDFVDPSAPGVDWQARLQETDIIFVSGGNTFHLLDQVRKTGFDEWLKARLDRIVYVGASAGSIIATPTIGISPVDGGDKNLPGITDLTGLHLVDFEISPHTPTDVSLTGNKAYAQTTPNKLYAINDQSAIVVQGTEHRIIHEGNYWEYN